MIIDIMLLSNSIAVILATDVLYENTLYNLSLVVKLG